MPQVSDRRTPHGTLVTGRTTPLDGYPPICFPDLLTCVNECVSPTTTPNSVHPHLPRLFTLSRSPSPPHPSNALHYILHTPKALPAEEAAEVDTKDEDRGTTTRAKT